ncbi:MAG: sensor histidine kinase [Clostridia bacterium]|nr:sensor histidine kinase [Clostridia bacterium]
MKLFSTIFKLFGNMSLQKKLIITYFVLIFFPLSTVGLIAYNISAASVKSEVARYISEVLQQVNDNIDNTVYELDRMASILISDEEVHRILAKDKNRPYAEIIRDEETMNNKINSLINFRTNIEGFFVFSYNGEVYSYNGANNSIRLDYTFTSTRWYEVMRSLNIKKLLLPTHIQDQVLSSGQKKVVFSLIREISPIDTRKSLGNILIDVNTDAIKKIWDKLNTQKYQEFVIVDNNKTIIYHTREEHISNQFRSNYISRILKSRNGSFITEVNNSPALITYNTSRLTNWTVISIIPVNILYKNIRNLAYIIVLFVTLCILLSFFIAVVLSRNITKPISTLRQLMKRAESGQFDINIPVKSKDEIGALSLSFNNMITRINSLIQTVYETRILKKEAELNALQAQINPHFLYNTLQIVDIIAEQEGIDVISTVCRSLSRMFRYSINRGKEIVPLSSEIEHVKDYINIQKIRFQDRFDVVYDIEPSLLKNKIIKLVLQPLVENALLHGVESKKEKCLITISAKKSHDQIKLYVEDTGMGMDEKQLHILMESIDDEIVHAELDDTDRRSIGLKNVNARIRLYFGEKYGITIDSKLNVGTRVTVTIPEDVHL